MKAILFDPEKHLSRSDQERLKELAKAAGMEPADFIEAVLKRAIFLNILPVPRGKEAA